MPSRRDLTQPGGFVSIQAAFFFSQGTILCVQIHKMLAADFDLGFVLTRCREVVGELHPQPGLRRTVGESFR